MSTTRNGPRAGSSSAVAPVNERRGLVDARQQLGAHADRLLGRVEEVVTVGRVTGGRCGGHAHPLDAEPVDPLAVLLEHGHGAVDGGGVEPSVGVDAGAEAGDAHQALVGGRAGARAADTSGSATSRRTELVPTSMAATRPPLTVSAVSQDCPSHSGLESAGGRLGSRPTQAPTGSSPPARYQA